MKIIIPIIVTALLFTIKVDAGYEEFVAKEKVTITQITTTLAQKQEISLEDAIVLVEAKIANNPEYSSKLKELLLIHEKNLSEYGAVRRKVDNQGNYTYEYSYGNPNRNPIANIKALEEQYNKEVETATKKVKTIYFDIVELSRNLDIEKLRVEQCSAELKATQTKFGMGATNKTEVYTKEANLASAEANRISVEKNLDMKLREFKLLTDINKYHLSDSYKFSLDTLIAETKDNLENNYYVPTNISKEIYDNHITLENLYQQLKDKEVALKKVTEGYNEDSIYYYNKEEGLGLPLLRDQIKEAENNLVISYSGEQSKLKNQIDYFQQSGAVLNLAQKKYQQAMVKYNNGQIKYTDFIKEKIEWISAQKTYDNSIKTIYLAIDNFNLAYSS